MPTHCRYAIIALCAFLASLFLGIVIDAWLATRSTDGAGQWQPAKPDPRIADTGTETVKPKDCTVIVRKPAAKQALDLPEPIKADPAKHVTAAVIIPPDEHPQSVVSLFDSATGQTETLTQRMEHPWLATEQRGQVWVGYGLAEGGRRAGRILLREDLLQVKALHLGGMASIDTGGQWFAGVGVAWRW